MLRQLQSTLAAPGQHVLPSEIRRAPTCTSPGTRRLPSRTKCVCLKQTECSPPQGVEKLYYGLGHSIVGEHCWS